MENFTIEQLNNKLILNYKDWIIALHQVNVEEQQKLYDEFVNIRLLIDKFKNEIIVDNSKND